MQGLNHIDLISMANNLVQKSAENLNSHHWIIPLGSPTHIVINIVFWTIFLLYLVFSGRVSEKIRMGMGQFIGILALANFAYGQLNEIDKGIWTLKLSLPLQLCSLSSLLAGYTILRGSQIGYEFLIYWGAGAIQSYVTPEITNGEGLFNLFDYCISHGCIILGSVYLSLRMGYKPRKGSWWKVFLYTQLVLPIIGGINWILGANYMFLCQKPLANNPFVMGEWPWYLLGLELVIIVHFYVFYHLHIALSKWGNTSSTHEKPQKIYQTTH
ncbi:MAG: TIGR02206 family membrane protein [Flavobacteriales bacterium]|nr:MAG: TIGR02206 family membrane protein [Flavobacteriales bacterium]